VFCDPTVRARDDVLSPDITLQAWSARDAGGLKLQRHFRDGSFAEQMMAARRAALEVGFDNRGLGLKP
jgi:alcohol dehydrogenase